MAHKAWSETELFEHWLDGFADQIGLDQLLFVFVWWMKRIGHMRRTDLAAWYFDVGGYPACKALCTCGWIQSKEAHVNLESYFMSHEFLMAIILHVCFYDHVLSPFTILHRVSSLFQTATQPGMLYKDMASFPAKMLNPTFIQLHHLDM